MCNRKSKNNKRFLMTLVLIVICLSALFAGCGKKEKTKKESQKAESTAESTVSETEAEVSEEVQAKAKEIVLSQTLRSADGLISVEVPSCWSDMTGQMGDVEASYPLRLGCPEEAALIIGCRESKTDSILTGLEDYTRTLYNGVTDNAAFSNVQDGSVSPITLGNAGAAGYRCRFTADSEKGRVAYWIYTTETDTDYYQLICWTTGGNVKAEEPVFEAIAAHLTVG